MTRQHDLCKSGDSVQNLIWCPGIYTGTITGTFPGRSLQYEYMLHPYWLCLHPCLHLGLHGTPRHPAHKQHIFPNSSTQPLCESVLTCYYS